VIRDLSSEIAGAYDRHVRGRPLEASLAATAAYFVTLGAVRVFTTIVRGPDSGYISIAGVHVHHLVFGVLALLIAGLFALDDVWRIARSVLFGIGAALVLDEFALLVFLKDVYWLPQGMLSVAALAIGVAALLINMWRGWAFFAAVGAAVQRHV
jgi:lysyl-tRNA synthetase class 2